MNVRDIRFLFFIHVPNKQVAAAIAYTNKLQAARRARSELVIGTRVTRTSVFSHTLPQ